MNCWLNGAFGRKGAWFTTGVCRYKVPAYRRDASPVELIPSLSIVKCLNICLAQNFAM